ADATISRARLPASPPSRRRAPEQPARAPRRAISWHQPSTLGELRSLAGLVQAGLLALDDPGVAGEEAGALHRDAQLGVGLDERAGDSVPDRTRLAARPAAVHAHPKVERPLNPGDPQRRQRQLAVRRTGEVLLDRAA